MINEITGKSPQSDGLRHNKKTSKSGGMECGECWGGKWGLVWNTSWHGSIADALTLRKMKNKTDA